MPFYHASYILPSPPTQQRTDELLLLDVDLSNSGDATWPHRGPGQLTLSYRWRDSVGRRIEGEGPHIRLPSPIKSGEAVRLELPVEAPERPGDYILELDLVQEGVAWLEELGGTPHAVPLRVQPATTGPRVCIINSSCRLYDAVGNQIIEQLRFFTSRGYRALALVEDIDERLPRIVRQQLAPCSLDTLRATSPTLATRRTVEHFNNADLYIVHYSAYYALAEAMRLVGRGQVIFDYHGVTPANLWSGVQGGEELEAGERNVALVRYADRAIVHSIYARDELLATGAIGSDRITVVPLVAPLDQFQPDPRDAELVARYKLENRPVLLYVGRMAANKRIIDLVRALPLIIQQHPGTMLLLVGDDRTPPYPALVAEARAEAEALHCADQVIFTGQVDDLRAFYNLCDVFVTASVHEGFCIPAVEAMACGKPVVGAHATALPDTIGPGGLTFRPGDPNDLAEKVMTILGDGSWEIGDRKGVMRST